MKAVFLEVHNNSHTLTCSFFHKTRTATYRIANLSHAQSYINYYYIYLYGISGSHSSKYEDDCLLGCCAKWSDRNLPIFRFSIFQQGTLTMEAVSTYEMSVSFCQTTQRNIPEEAVIFISIFVIIINNFLDVLSVVAVLVETGTLNLSHGINSVVLLLKQLKSSFYLTTQCNY
jgi:hypothetical protein